jgi:hypothetical protein
MHDSFCTKRSVGSKLTKNQNSSWRLLSFLRLVQMSLHSVAILYSSQRNIKIIFGWHPSSELNLWNKLLKMGLTEPQLVSHSSNPSLCILNHDCADWNTMLYSNIKFLKEESSYLRTGCETYSHFHKQLRANSWTFDNWGHCWEPFQNRISYGVPYFLM